MCHSHVLMHRRILVPGPLAILYHPIDVYWAVYLVLPGNRPYDTGLCTTCYWASTMPCTISYLALDHIVPGHQPCTMGFCSMCYRTVETFYWATDHELSWLGPQCTGPTSMSYGLFTMCYRPKTRSTGLWTMSPNSSSVLVQRIYGRRLCTTCYRAFKTFYWTVNHELTYCTLLYLVIDPILQDSSEPCTIS